jgi:hypothetical protein
MFSRTIINATGSIIYNEKCKMCCKYLLLYEAIRNILNKKYKT